MISRKSGSLLMVVFVALGVSTTPLAGEIPAIEVVFEQDLPSMTVDWPSPRLEDFRRQGEQDLFDLMSGYFGFWKLGKAKGGLDNETMDQWRITGRLYKGGPKQARVRLELWQPALASEPGQDLEPRLAFHRDCELWGPLGNEFDRKIAREWNKIADDVRDGFDQLLGCLDGPTSRCDSIQKQDVQAGTCNSGLGRLMENLKTIPVAETSFWDQKSLPISVIGIPVSPEMITPSAVLRLDCPGDAACTDLLARSLGPISNLSFAVTEPTVVRFGHNRYCIRDGIAQIGREEVHVDETLSPLTPVYLFEIVDSELRSACPTGGGFR